METLATPRSSVFGLVRDLAGETKTFIRQEIELAKTEISEKISSMGKNTVSLAIGGFAAYAGLIVFLIALGALIAYAFQAANFSPWMSAFLGFGMIGLLVMGVGGAFIAKAINAFKRESLAPERTLNTLHELKSHEIANEKPEKKEDKPSSKELEEQVEYTESQMEGTLGELGHRLSPRHINAQMKHRIQERPYRAGLLAMAAGFISALFLTRRKAA